MKKMILTNLVFALALSQAASAVTATSAKKPITALPKVQVSGKKTVTAKTQTTAHKTIKKSAVKTAAKVAAPLAVSQAQALRLMTMNSENMAVIITKARPTKTTTGLYEMSEYSLSQTLESHRLAGDVVRYDLFSCKNISIVDAAECSFPVEQVGSAGYGTQVIYSIRVQQNKSGVDLIPAIKELAPGEFAPALSARVELKD